MTILLSVLYVLLLSILLLSISWFRVHHLSRIQLVILFLVKIGFGTALTLIYTYHYTDRSKQDIYKYFDDSKPLYDAFSQNTVHYLQLVTGINDDDPALKQYLKQTQHWYRSEQDIFTSNRPLIRFNAVFRLISGGSIYVHTIFMCFLSLCGLIAIFKLLSPHFQRRKRELIFSIFLLPSVLFWGSGLLKEGLILFSLGILIYSFHKILKQSFTIRHLVAFLLGTSILVSIKLYVFAALAPALVGQALFFRLGKERPLFYHFVALTVIAFLVFLIPRVIPMPTASELIAGKNDQFIELARKENAGSFIESQQLEPNVGSLLTAVPAALTNTFLRPFILTADGLFQKAIALENLLIYLILLLAIIFPRLPEGEKGAFTWMGLSFTILLFLIIGWSSPILGAIVRYKVLALPFFLASCIQLINKRRLLRTAPFLDRVL
jgi:hypothetical protein